jgi:raffinose/stachyose/melibiose transport system permease protein/N-acetylglucosamine transport system permease protein
MANLSNKLLINKGKSKDRSNLGLAIKIIVCIIFLIYAVTLIYPFLWMSINALKTKEEFYRDVFAFPESWKFSNYYDAIVNFKITVGSGANTRYVNLLQMFGMSIFLTATVTVLEILVSSGTAYVLAKYKFRGRGLIYGVIIFAYVAPIVGSMPATYRFMNQIHLLNTIPGVLLLYVGGVGFAFLILYGHFKNLSWSYAEAAFMDGANDFQVFFKVMLPLSTPTLTAMAVVTAISYWNDFNTPRIYLESYPTLAVGINQLMTDMRYLNEYPMMFACMIVSVVPIIVFFCCFQKSIMKNMVAGGLKG